MRIGAFASGIAILATAAAATPPETITYTYDAQGRLVKVAHSGTINNGVQAVYTHDKADNRTNVTVTGSGNAAPAGAAASDTSAFDTAPSDGQVIDNSTGGQANATSDPDTPNPQQQEGDAPPAGDISAGEN